MPVQPAARVRDADRTRAELLDVATRHFAEHGFSGARVDVEHLDPIAAIRRLAEVTFDHHEAHPDVVRLVSIENIHRAEHMVRSSVLAQLNTTAIDVIARIVEAGHRRGAFCRQAVAYLTTPLLSAMDAE